MALNIIQRLTFLSSFLSALVIAVAMVSLGYLMWDSHARDAAHRSGVEARLWDYDAKVEIMVTAVV